MRDKPFRDFHKEQDARKLVMIEEADLINISANWLADMFDKKLLEIERAETNNSDYLVVEKLKEECYHLLIKLNRELKNMDDYMVKYTELIANEKKTLLSIIREEKSLSLRGVSTNKSGSRQSKRVSH